VGEKKRNNLEFVVQWLCGIWAFGLGLRFIVEFWYCDSGWLHIPKHPINIYFDFLPLCILGMAILAVSIKEIKI
jgi:hypothetical protein